MAVQMTSPVLVVDILSVVGADARLHRVARDEYAGACPFCGGTDRFRVSTRLNRWWCRRCSDSDHWESPAAFVMLRDDCSYRAALEKLGDVPLIPLPPPKPTEPTPEDRIAFGRIAALCASRLPTYPAVLDWLADRGITADDAARWQIGYCAGQPGEKSWTVDRYLWCGVTIPLVGVDDQTYGIQVRRGQKPLVWDEDRDWRYAQLWGSVLPLYGQPTQRDVCVLVEGTLDAILLQRIVGDLVDVAALGTTLPSIPDRWLPYLLAHSRWLIATDSDPAGDKAGNQWCGNYPNRALRLRVPPTSARKDPSDWWKEIAPEQGAVAADRALREWVGSMLDG